MMWCKTIITFLFLTIFYPYQSFADDKNAKSVYAVVEPHNETCKDPNAETRSDTNNCALKCTQPSLLEDEGSCFKPHKLEENCYCKNGYLYDETKKLCVSLPDCTCNKTLNRISRFSNECGNSCVGFHRKNCSLLLRSGCWCSDTYCQNDQGTCVLR